MLFFNKPFSFAEGFSGNAGVVFCLQRPGPNLLNLGDHLHGRACFVCFVLFWLHIFCSASLVLLAFTEYNISSS